MARKMVWRSWETTVHDGRKIRLSVDQTAPADMVPPVVLQVGRGAPVTMTAFQARSLVDALWSAVRAADEAAR